MMAVALASAYSGRGRGKGRMPVGARRVEIGASVDLALALWRHGGRRGRRRVPCNEGQAMRRLVGTWAWATWRLAAQTSAAAAAPTAAVPAAAVPAAARAGAAAHGRCDYAPLPTAPPRRLVQRALAKSRRRIVGCGRLRFPQAAGQRRRDG
jgi:hypothetical protein